MFFKSIFSVAICFVVSLSYSEGYRTHRIGSHRHRMIDEGPVEESYHAHPRIIPPSQQRHYTVQNNGMSLSKKIALMLFNAGTMAPSEPEEEPFSENRERIGAAREQNVEMPQNGRRSWEEHLDDGDADMANPCGLGKSCTSEAEENQRRIEIIKKSLLKKLRLDVAPNITVPKINRNSPGVKSMFSKYEHAEKRAQFEADKVSTKQIISTAKLPPFSPWQSTANWFHFEFTREETKNFEVKAATLWVYVRPKVTNITRATVEVTDYQTRFNDTVHDLDVSIDKRQSQKIMLHRHTWSGFWKKVNLTNVVRRWVQDPTKNLGIDISSTSISDLIATGRSQEEENFTPYLNVKLMLSAKDREKRSALLDCSSSEYRCCRKQFLVRFEEIGWDWVIAPREMNLRYCGGKCSFAQITNPHSSFVRHTNVGDEEQKKTCCVPSAWTPMSMLYYDLQSVIIYNEIPQMVIHDCDCP